MLFLLSTWKLRQVSAAQQLNWFWSIRYVCMAKYIHRCKRCRGQPYGHSTQHKSVHTITTPNWPHQRWRQRYVASRLQTCLPILIRCDWASNVPSTPRFTIPSILTVKGSLAMKNVARLLTAAIDDYQKLWLFPHFTSCPITGDRSFASSRLTNCPLADHYCKHYAPVNVSSYLQRLSYG